MGKYRNRKCKQSLQLQKASVYLTVNKFQGEPEFLRMNSPVKILTSLK